MGRKETKNDKKAPLLKVETKRKEVKNHAAQTQKTFKTLLAILPVAPQCPLRTPPPWMMGRPSPEEEVEDLKEHIEMLKEELKAAEEDLKEMEKSK